MLTNQEVVDLSVGAIIQQGCLSYEDNGRVECLYRGPGGIKCAAGHLIPDSDYHLEFEGSCVTDSEFGDFWESRVEDTSLVEDLQELHDRAASKRSYSYWLKSVKEYLDASGLRCEALEEISQ